MFLKIEIIIQMVMVIVGLKDLNQKRIFMKDDVVEIGFKKGE